MQRKIIHLWSFGDTKVEPWSEAQLKDINFLYRWRNGTEVRTPLYYISCRTDPISGWCENKLPWLQNILSLD